MTNKKDIMLQIKVNQDQFDLIDRAYKYYLSQSKDESISRTEFMRQQLMLRNMAILNMVVLPEVKNDRKTS